MLHTSEFQVESEKHKIKKVSPPLKQNEYDSLQILPSLGVAVLWVYSLEWGVSGHWHGVGECGSAQPAEGSQGDAGLSLPDVPGPAEMCWGLSSPSAASVQQRKGYAQALGC